MNAEYQIIVSLIFMILVILFIIILVIHKSKVSKVINQGIKIGEKFPNIIVYNSINQKVPLLKEIYSQKIDTLILIDVNCSQCEKVLKTLKIIKPEYLKNIRFLAVGSEDITSKISNHSFQNQLLLAQMEDVINQIKVNGFPFIFKNNIDGTITSKGYISEDTITKYIN
ncbi:hypothetical protein PQ460_20340 [Paenibacillus sp. KACC 21273]|uniref:hypothetical protein n=1 Tax=Paenibacillus sp. KACC 21273 TaxID=3025665 RepID=UPI0023660F84|nr:hypothetical protein [Paenibacillus sp. KACC 21273]WDF50307.1 hypothetical protein PQ460_20340 [Paenibacillus sp. KACC 21273]